MRNRKIFCMMILSILISLCACGNPENISSEDKTQSEQSDKISESEMVGNSENAVESEAAKESGIIEGDTHPYIGTKKATLKATDTMPEVDGIKDSLYDTVGTLISLDEFNLEYWAEKPRNNSAVVYLTYDADYIYLFVEISDDFIDYTGDEVWKKDSVGVILDFNYIREKAEYEIYNGDKIGYVNIACDNSYEYYHEYVSQSYASMISYQSVIDVEQGEYTIEMRLPFIEEFTGETLGFEVMNTDCINGDRCGVRTWNIDGSQMHKYTHCTGTLEFETDFWN